MSSSLRSVLMVAAPALAALIGLFWFASRKKNDKADDRKPPDKLNKTTNASRAISHVPGLQSEKMPPKTGNAAVRDCYPNPPNEIEETIRAQESCVSHTSPGPSQQLETRVKSEEMMGGDNAHNALCSQSTTEELHLPSHGEGDGKDSIVAEAKDIEDDTSGNLGVSESSNDELVEFIAKEVSSLNNNMPATLATESPDIELNPDSKTMEESSPVTTNLTSNSETECHLAEERTTSHGSQEQPKLRASNVAHSNLQNTISNPSSLCNDAEATECNVDKDISKSIASHQTVSGPVKTEEKSVIDKQVDSGSGGTAEKIEEAHCNGGCEAEVSQVNEKRTAVNQGLSIESPISESNSDHSEMSADSGNGQSIGEVTNPADQREVLTSYEFNFPSELCGLLIGRQGKHINVIKDKSGANISVKTIPFVEELQAVYIEGTQSQVDKALSLIKQRFPPSRFSEVDFTETRQMTSGPVLQPEMMQLNLPVGVSLEVIVSSVVQPNHIFVQQPTHPTFPMLERMNQVMNICYLQDGVVPQLPRPIEVGVICAAPMYNGWYRAQVVMFHEEQDECDIRFVDYGGYMRIQGCYLRQIRSDFTTLPFQAVECYLANVIAPKDSENFPEEAGAVLESLVQGKLLQTEVVAHEEDGVPYVQLYEMHGDQMTLLNRELVDRGLAQWLEQF